jgi:sodium/potassium-transporting ATPase subunit alpha
VPASYDPSDGQQPALTFPLGYRKEQLVFAWNWGVAPNGLGADNLAAGIEASSVYFVCAVVCQWGHLLSVRIKTPYLFAAIMDQAGEGGSVCARICSELQCCRPKLSVIAAILFSALFALIFTEVPALQSTCGTASVAGEWWGLALCFSFVIFIIAEARKWLIALFPRSWIAKVAW